MTAAGSLTHHFYQSFIVLRILLSFKSYFLFLFLIRYSYSEVQMSSLILAIKSHYLSVFININSIKLVKMSQDFACLQFIRTASSSLLKYDLKEHSHEESLSTKYTGEALGLPQIRTGDLIKIFFSVLKKLGFLTNSFALYKSKFCTLPPLYNM
jgi:hypothetical protein